MRSIDPQTAAIPSAQGLHEAVSLQDVSRAVAAVHGTGIAKGEHGFKTQLKEKTQRLDALDRVIAANTLRGIDADRERIRHGCQRDGPPPGSGRRPEAPAIAAGRRAA